MDKGKQALAVVLARSGSKGLPRKNALLVAGRPMVVWSIDHALQSTTVSRVVLSTDGDELAGIGKARGVDVVLRPAALASDTATVDSAARHAVLTVGQAHGIIVILYGNIPVRPADLTDRAVTKLMETGADSVQSVCPVGKTHPYWMKKLSGDRLLMYEENSIYRRQDLPPVYMLDGGVIAVRRESLMIERDGEPHAFLGQDRRAIVTRPGDVVDVDDAVDLRIAEGILASRSQSAGSS